MSRIAIPEFQTANAIYARGTVTVWQADVNGIKTATKATVYDAETGSGTLDNPLTLDSHGRWTTQPFIEVPVILSISGLSVDDHDTAVIFAGGTWRGDWATATEYYPNDFVRDGANGTDTGDLWIVVTEHTSGTWATDIADATKLALAIDISTVASAIASPGNPADDGKYLVGSGGAWTKSAAALQSFMVTFLADANAAAALSTLGGQPLDATLNAIAALTALTDNTIARLNGTDGVYQGSGWSIDDADLMTAAGVLQMADNLLKRAALIDTAEEVNSIGDFGGGSQDIDFTLGHVVKATVSTSTVTFTFSNPPATGHAGSFTLKLTNGGSQTINWPASVDWVAGSAPTLTAAGLDVLTFFTDDGGTTYYGFVVGLDVK